MEYSLGKKDHVIVLVYILAIRNWYCEVPITYEENYLSIVVMNQGQIIRGQDTSK
jgi:hypothetical protein